MSRRIEESGAPLPKSWCAVLVVLSAILLLGIFSTEIADTDFWWHLKTGDYIVENRALPLPDPFSYASSVVNDSQLFPDELAVRDFNLTHEWLSQAAMSWLYAAAGLPGIIVFRALLLTFVCAMAGLIVWRRGGGFFAALASGLIPAALLTLFASDRPSLVTFAFAAAFVAILDEYRRGGSVKLLALLPALGLIWANAHGGFFIGWVVLAAFVFDSLLNDQARRGPLWIAAAATFLVTGLNPNGFGILTILPAYGASEMTSTLIEWKSPPLWGPPWEFPAILFSSAAVAVLAWRRVPLSDFLLLAAFAGAAITAFRNLPFLAFMGAVVLGSYAPEALRLNRLRVPVKTLAATTACLLVGLFGWRAMNAGVFQMRAADWRFPAGAAEFISDAGLQGRMFNSYEHGGYLIWALGPERKTLVDGRALSEEMFRAYQLILRGSASTRDSGEHWKRMLDDFGVEYVVTAPFEFNSGVVYYLIPALNQDLGWSVVYADNQAAVAVRNNGANRQLIQTHGLSNQEVADYLLDACRAYVEKQPQTCNCAKTLGLVYNQAGVTNIALEFLEMFERNSPFPDEVVTTILGRLRSKN